VSGSSRRDLLKGALVLPLATQVKAVAKASPASRPLAISSANGLRAVEKAYAVVAAGGDPVDAVVAGVNIVEDDPNDVTVGYGGIPNEEGVVQLDASVMDGRSMKAGSVGALENIKNPSKVARLVMEQTNRVFLVGPGALKFAKAHGFPEENLLTERSRKIWLYWKEKLSGKDDWIERGDEEEKDPDIRWYIEKYGVEDFRPQGTINCDVVTREGVLAGCTTTSGLFFKMAKSGPAARRDGVRGTCAPAAPTPSSSPCGKGSRPRRRPCGRSSASSQWPGTCGTSSDGQAST